MRNLSLFEKRITTSGWGWKVPDFLATPTKSSEQNG